jgi:hypothetical protein
LAALDFVDAIDDDDGAVRALKGTLQGLDKGSPEVFFVCLGVGSAAGLVDEGVVARKFESVLRSHHSSVC